MRRLAAFILFAASCWAACNSPATYTVGTGKTYATVADALAAMVTTCGYTVPFGATQTVSVYAAGGPYGAVAGETWPLAPTATNQLIITAAPGENPVFNCGGSTANLLNISTPYTAFKGFEATGCGRIFSGDPHPNVEVSYNYIHDSSAMGSAAIFNNAASTGWWVHHNRIVNVPLGILVKGNALIEYNEVGATTGLTAEQINGGSTGVSCTIRNNIVYGAGSQSGSGVWADGAPAVISGNVIYYNYDGFVVANSGPSDLATASNNIVAYPSNHGCHCEGGLGGCWENVDHDLCLKDFGGYPVDLASTNFSPPTISFTSSISWADTALSAVSRNMMVTSTPNTVYSDYNIFMKTGTPYTAVSTGGTVTYAALADWQATGRDTHTVQVDPRFVGSVGLLNTADRLFPECPTIECRLAKIRHNYTPTNLALKGTGCAWNGTTCVPDHSDIGPVPVTVYDAPGITGGGAY